MVVVALVGLLLLSVVVRSSFFRDLATKIRAARWQSLIIVGLLISWFTVTGAPKTPDVVGKLFRLLFFNPVSQTWPLMQPDADITAAEAAVAQAEADLAQADAIVESNEVWTLSFDWPAPARVPYHPRQNVLAWTAKVAPTNIAGTLYEDHYVCFNAAASTNPAVILIEYARTLDGGEVERVSAAVVTNSHPEMSVVELQSGSYTCYWFRCEVPAAYTACVRDWNGEALFGSPADSEKGFDLLGTLVIDDGGDVWVGATTNIVIGGVTNTIRNGIVTKD